MAAKPWNYTYADVWGSDTPPDSVKAVNDADQLQQFLDALNERITIDAQLFGDFSPTLLTMPADGDGLAEWWTNLSEAVPVLAGYTGANAQLYDDGSPAPVRLTFLALGNVWKSNPLDGSDPDYFRENHEHVYHPQAQYQRLAFNLSQTASAGQHLLFVGPSTTFGSNTGKIFVGGGGTSGVAITYDADRSTNRTSATYGLADVARIPDPIDVAAGASTSIPDRDPPSFLPNDYYLNQLRNRINVNVAWQIGAPGSATDPQTYAEITKQTNWGFSDGTTTDSDGNVIYLSLSDAQSAAEADFNSGAHVNDDTGMPTFGGAFPSIGDVCMLIFPYGYTNTDGSTGTGYECFVRATKLGCVIHNPPTAYAAMAYVGIGGIGTDYVVHISDGSVEPYSITTYGNTVYDNWDPVALTTNGHIKTLFYGSGVQGPGDWTAPQTYGNHLVIPGAWPTLGADIAMIQRGFMWQYAIVGSGGLAYGSDEMGVMAYDGTGGFAHTVST